MRNIITTVASAVALNVAIGGVAMAQSDTINIGVQLPTTGSEATYGIDMLNAMKLAVEEINASGGVLDKQIVLSPADAACDPQQSVNAASMLASQNVVGVVGGYCSGATQPTLNTYGDANIPFVIIAANSTKLIPANPGNAFMINSTGDYQAETAVDFFESQGVEKLAIVNQGDAYSQDLANLTRDEWKAAGHEIAAFDYVNKGEQDFSAVVSNIRNADADAVFWTAYYADGALLIRQLRQRGYQGVIAVGDGSTSSKLFDIAGRAAEGVYAFANPIPAFLPGAQDFNIQYESEYGNAPGPYAPLSYDGLQLMAWAIEKAGSTDSDAIQKALASADGVEWLTGPISFTEANTLARSNFIVLEGKGGEWTRHEQ